jgi:hypothetical protein
VFFIGGWYLRTTAENLRRYRAAARTSQAVVAIVAGFTFLLLPFSIYSLWVLFSHRGRIYYEARGRGLTEHQAARHTYRMLEEPYGASTPAADVPPPPPPPPVRPVPSAAPRPSQIPVQSMVTSEVAPPSQRLSGIVRAGLVFAAITTLLLAVSSFRGVPMGAIPMTTFATFALLFTGFLHALCSRRARGAGLAFAVLVLFGIFGAGLWMSGGRSEARTEQREIARAREGISSARTVLVGRLRPEFALQVGSLDEPDATLARAMAQLQHAGVTLARNERAYLLEVPPGVPADRYVDLACHALRSFLGDGFEPQAR